MSTLFKRRRRGMTVTEVVVGGALLVAVVALLAPVTRACGLTYHNRSADADTQRIGTKMVNTIAQDIRRARRVSIAEPTRIQLVLPAYETDGRIRVPLQDGDSLTIFVGTDDAQEDPEGSIIWKHLASEGEFKKVDEVAVGGLEFGYHGMTSDPSSVVITVAAVQETMGRDQQVNESTSKTQPFHGYLSGYLTTQEAILRNR